MNKIFYVCRQDGCKKPIPFILWKMGLRGEVLFHKYEINGEYQTDGSCDVVPFQCFSLEENHGKGSKNNQGNDFLYHL